MKLYDISIPVSNSTIVWPDDPPVSIKASKSIAKGDACNLSKVEMGVHVGTHIDAPLHFIKGGDAIDKIPMETFIGQALVVEVDSKEVIKKKDLEGHNLSGHRRVLIKTRNSKLWEKEVKEFDKNFVSIGIDAAKYLIEMKVALIGVDYLSVEGFHSKDNAVHKLLLGEGIALLEGLNLSAVNSGEYELICLPLKLEGCEASPARALLKEMG